MITLTTISPTDYQKAKPIKITYGFHETPFGPCLVAVEARGLCFFGFVAKGKAALDELHKNWLGAELVEDTAVTESFVQEMFAQEEPKIKLFVKGTALQVAVWKALLAIKSGETKSYSEIAQLIGERKAVRAVASAIAYNPVSYLIPCHRVVLKSGEFHGYRWGTQCKKALLEHEGIAR